MFFEIGRLKQFQIIDKISVHERNARRLLQESITNQRMIDVSPPTR